MGKYIVQDTETGRHFTAISHEVMEVFDGREDAPARIHPADAPPEVARFLLTNFDAAAPDFLKYGTDTVNEVLKGAISALLHMNTEDGRPLEHFGASSLTLDLESRYFLASDCLRFVWYCQQYGVGLERPDDLGRAFIHVRNKYEDCVDFVGRNFGRDAHFLNYIAGRFMALTIYRAGTGWSLGGFGYEPQA